MDTSEAGPDTQDSIATQPEGKTAEVKVKIESDSGKSDAGAQAKTSVDKQTPNLQCPVKVEEIADEDVPEDFFDDFLKEDFMAGLDIIDEDNEESDELIKDQVTQLPKKVKQSRKGKTEAVNKPPSKAQAKVKKKAAAKKAKKGLEKVGIDVNHFDIRRDPEKTRQAIQRDKMKSVKDKEKRLITDIVQTGLVPPGMELEVDIGEVCGLDKVDNLAIKDKLKHRVSEENGGDKETKKRKRSSPLKSREPDSQKHAKSERSRVSRRSPAVRRRSPFRRSPVFSRTASTHSNLFSRTSSPLDAWPRGRSPSRRISRQSPSRRKRSPGSRSPVFRRRSRSRSFTTRRGVRRSRSRDRSPNYRRSRRDGSYSPARSASRRKSSPRARKEEKMSFLEELAAKLNETHGPQSMAYATPNYHMPPAVPMVMEQPCVPVGAFFNPSAAMPQPMSAGVQPTQYDPYDESFFIGNPVSVLQQPVNQFEENFPPKLPVNAAPGRPQPPLNAATTEEMLFTTKDVPKLFADRRIKLSDFLAITAKPPVSSTTSTKLQEKIKVIQRCQDAIKVLNERKFTGPLMVHKTSSYSESKEMTASPLLRKPIVQLPFTTPGMEVGLKDFRQCCDVLLSRVGISKPLPLSELVPPKEESRATALPLEAAPQPCPEAPTPLVKSFSTQTDKDLFTSSCRECSRRRNTLFSNCAVQTGSPVVTFSVSTQVAEADFYSMIPKSQSLASLTPAQLLGKQSMIEQSRGSRLNQVPTPPPAPFIRHQKSPYGSSLFNQALLSQILHPKPPMHEKDSFNGADRGRGGFHKRF